MVFAYSAAHYYGSSYSGGRGGIGFRRGYGIGGSGFMSRYGYYNNGFRRYYDDDYSDNYYDDDYYDNYYDGDDDRYNRYMAYYRPGFTARRRPFLGYGMSAYRRNFMPVRPYFKPKRPFYMPVRPYFKPKRPFYLPVRPYVKTKRPFFMPKRP